MPFADAEGLVRSALATAFPTARVVTETPADLGAELPLFAVNRIGGGDEFGVLDASTVDVAAYAATRLDARLWAEKVRAWLVYRLPGTNLAGAHFGLVSTVMAPRWVPYDNTNVRRVIATYSITIRSVPIEGVPS